VYSRGFREYLYHAVLVSKVLVAQQSLWIIRTKRNITGLNEPIQLKSVKAGRALRGNS
jgi:hypothetical protein